MAISLAQAVKTGNVGGQTSITIALNGAVTAHSLLTLQVFYYSNVTGYVPDVPTDGANTWLAAGNAVAAPSTSGAGSCIFYLPDAAAGTHTVVFTLPAGGSGNIWATLSEWAGPPTASPLGGSNVHTTAAMSQSGDSNAATPDGATDLILCSIGIAAGTGATDIFIHGAGSTPATAQGYTQTLISNDDASNAGGEQAYLIGTALSGAQTANWVWEDGSSTTGYQACIATFKAAAAGGMLNQFRKNSMSGGMADLS